MTKRLLIRSAALVGAASSAAVGLSGCDASAYAATIDGHEITQTSFNSTLKVWASSPVAAQVGVAAVPGATVGGTGTGTYSTSFAGTVLSDLVLGQVLRQATARAGHPATPDARITARAYWESSFGCQQGSPCPEGLGTWDQLPESVRELYVEFAADEGMLTPPSGSAGTYGQFVAVLAPYFFRQVCVRSATVFSADAASSIVAQGVVGGTTLCYDQQQFEQQPQAFQAAVVGLDSVGKVAAPIKTPYGYQVIALAARDAPPLSTPVEGTLSAIVSPSADPSVAAAIGRAHVKVNPLYGTWQDGQVVTPEPPPNS